METKVLTYREPKSSQLQSKSLTYYVQRIEELQVSWRELLHLLSQLKYY